MKFKQFRKECGFTLADVAEYLGCSVKTVLRIENGERIPKADVFYKLSLLYKRALEDFYGEPDPPYAPRARSKGSGASSKH
jgi:transcriptional regulator with XRE-family HTH domain